ncbi:MAG: hypothetical protein AAF449_10535, partial [Myxococcota bacterium]
LALLMAGPSVGRAEVTRPRIPAVLVVLTPPGRSVAAPESSVIGAATTVLRWQTDLDVLSAEQAGVDSARLSQCGAQRRMTCWVRAVGGFMRRRPQDAVRYALVVVAQPAGSGRDRLATWLVDVSGARKIAQTVDRSDVNWRERVEEQIFESTVQSPPMVVDVRDGDALDNYFQDVLTRGLRDYLVDSGRWWPSGRLRIRGAPTGLAIEVDHQALGQTVAEDTEVGVVHAGLREVVVRGPDDHEIREVVEVPIGGEVTVEWYGPPKGVHLSRAFTRWGGLGIIAAGAIVTGLGGAQAGDVDAVCIVRSGDPDCASLGPITVGFDLDRAPTTDPRLVNPSGLQLTSLGAALMTSGAAWSAGGWFWGPDESPPWWTWLVGAAVGGTTYAVAAAAQGG